MNVFAASVTFATLGAIHLSVVLTACQLPILLISSLGACICLGCLMVCIAIIIDMSSITEIDPS